MDTNTQSKQTSYPIVRAIIMSEIFIMLFSAFFAYINSEFWCAIQPYDCSLPFYILYFSRTLIFPAMIVVLIGGLLIWFILSIIKIRTSNILTSILGLIISIIIILITDYVLWVILQPGNYLGKFSFLEFAISKVTNDLFGFIFLVNPFIVPSIIAVTIIIYLGWKINKSRFPNVILPTKD
jgi:hypothetical protein